MIESNKITITVTAPTTLPCQYLEFRGVQYAFRYSDLPANFVPNSVGTCTYHYCGFCNVTNTTEVYPDPTVPDKYWIWPITCSNDYQFSAYFEVLEVS